MTSNPNFTYLWEKIPESRVILLQGSTRSGKTYAIIDFLIDYCLRYKGLEIDMTRETYKALKATAWKDFMQRLLDFNLYNPDNHNKSDSIYTLNGNTINYFGSDDHGKVHGKSRDILWLNEAQLASPDVVSQLFPRTRHRIICDFNPALGAEHWLDEYLTKYPPLITTYKDNPHLTPSQVEDIESRRDNKYWWSIYGEGKRANVEGAVFENWEQGTFPEGVEHWYGMDFGYSNDPTALVKVAIDKREKTIYLKEEVYSTHLKTSDIAQLCQRICEKHPIIADSAEPRLIAELRGHGLNIQGAKKVSIVEGVVLMNDYKMIIEGENLRKELSLYRWADKGRTLPIDAHNHCFSGDTIIETDKGNKRIDSMSVGDFVATSQGKRRVLKVWNNGVKKTIEYRMQFDTYSLYLRCTPDHRVKTNEGWIAISQLKEGQTVYLSKSLMEKSINYIQTKDTLAEEQSVCTGLFGSTTKGKYRKGITYITKTITHTTIISKTLTWSMKCYTKEWRVSAGIRKTMNGAKGLLRKVLRQQKNGINQKQEENGIQNTVRKHGTIESTKHSRANNAAKSTRQDTQESRSTATITVKLKRLEQGEERSEIVYDLTIEEYHEYFANGLLVHNCIDAARYACLFRLTTPNHGKYVIG